MLARLILYLLPFSMLVEFTFIGRLLLTDILCAVLVLALVFRRSNHKATADERYFYVFALLWLAGAVVTDLYLETPFEQYSRGWAKIGFFIVNFTAIRWLIGKSVDRAVFFIFLLFAANALRIAFGIGGVNFLGGVFGTGWKFGYGSLFTAACFLISAAMVSRLPTRPAGLILPFFSSILSLLANARSLFGLSAVAALMAATAFWKRQLRPAMVGVFAIILAASIGGIFLIYSYTASRGILGIEAQQKYELQTQGEIGLLFGGRVDAIAAIQAVLDSPIIGHGSWARDPWYVSVLVERLQFAGMQPPDYLLTSDYIPSHSYLLGAWVESGILGAVFWAWALWITVRGLYAAFRYSTPYTGFIMFIGITLLWDIFFSPFGLDRRVTVAAWLYLMMLSSHRLAVSHFMESPVRRVVRSSLRYTRIFASASPRPEEKNGQTSERGER